MASAVASTSAYVFPSAHEPPPPPPPAPPVQQQPVAPATPAPTAAGALDEDSEFSDYQGDDDDDDDEDEDQLSDGERAERKRRRKDQLDGVSLGSGDSPGLSGGRLKRYPCPHPGCIKCYTRPIRLEEHLRSHTGEVSSVSPSRLSAHLSTSLKTDALPPPLSAPVQVRRVRRHLHPRLAPQGPCPLPLVRFGKGVRVSCLRQALLDQPTSQKTLGHGPRRQGLRRELDLPGFISETKDRGD
jgi:hypothetical protein